MKYGYIKSDKAVYVFRTENGKWAGGRVFYSDDDTKKTADEIIAEMNLKEIITPNGFNGNYGDYYFTEQDNKIVLTALSKEALDRQSEKEKANRIIFIKNRLNALSMDIVQEKAGEIVPDIEERKAEFVGLHNELREYLNLEQRETK